MNNVIKILNKANKIFSVQTVQISASLSKNHEKDCNIAVIVYYGTSKRNDMALTADFKNNIHDSEETAKKLIELIESNIKNVKFELSKYTNGKNSIIWENSKI